jgi:hypothetical protein
MTRDEARSKCIEAIKVCHQTYEIGYFSDFQAARILDSLATAGVHVNLPEATEGMLDAAILTINAQPRLRAVWRVMSAAGNLLNPPETEAVTERKAPDPLIRELFAKLPPINSVWGADQRDAWLEAASAILDVVYRDKTETKP